MILYHGNIILPETVMENAYMGVEDGIITYISKNPIDAEELIEMDGFIAPGFVDIHCHDCPIASGYDEPQTVSNYHYDRGTTSMLITIYRGYTHDEYMGYLNKIKDLMPKLKNLRGVHLEGPYLNGKYGALTSEQEYPKKEDYMDYISTGVIRQWTCAPEVKGNIQFISDIKRAGIVPAIGHSEASCSKVKESVFAGAGIVTHIFDATGTTPDMELDEGFRGTHDVSFSEACMLFDNLYYEVICDRDWVHVRKEMLELLVKTVGIDKVVTITDCTMAPDDSDMDINIKNGELSGSRLTMNRVARNLKNAGYTMSEISKMTARNPARAINLEKRGEIAVGNFADLIVVDSNYNFVRHLL